MVRRAKTSVSAIRISELEGKNRIDAEYWHPIFLENESILNRVSKRYDVLPISKLVKRVTGSAFYPSIADDYSYTSGMPFIRVADLGEFFVKHNQLIRVPEEIIGDMRQIVKVKEGDIVIAKGGSIGGVSLIQDGLGKCATSRDVIVLQTDQNKIDSIYLTAYLTSRFGKLQFERYKSQQVQAHLTFPAVENIRIIVPEREKQLLVAYKVKKAIEVQKLSQQLYKDAENFLASELGLNKVDLSASLFAIRSFSDAQSAKRIDAEYYKPKYQRLSEHLRKTGQTVKLADWVREPLKRGIQPEYSEDGQVIVINSQHVGKTHIEVEDNRFTTKEFCQTGTNKRALVKQYDVLLNSTGYITIGRSQTLLEEIDAIVDGHVTIIRPKDDIDPVYLGLYLNSLPGQLQTERGWTGSSGQIELRIDVVENFLVWKAPTSVQKQIRQLIEQAHQARKEAKRLLTEAKQEVEKMIEGS